MSQDLYVQYGCGFSAPEGWVNFDISPSLRIQKIPIMGKILLKIFHPVFFPDNVRYGDIIKGLPRIKANSCKGVYCSHTLEHLSLDDCRTALQNTFEILEDGGTFRCVLPDLEIMARTYVDSLAAKDGEASVKFMKDTLLGFAKRPGGLIAKLRTAWGNANHLWMWDHYSLAHELKQVGFSQVRVCKFNDSENIRFLEVEEANRFNRAIALEAIK